MGEVEVLVGTGDVSHSHTYVRVRRKRTIHGAVVYLVTETSIPRADGARHVTLPRSCDAALKYIRYLRRRRRRRLRRLRRSQLF